MTNITLVAPPGSDIWRKPPHTNIFNAPTAPPPSPSSSTGPLKSFRSARLSFSFPWSAQYDQAGLLLSLFPRNNTSAVPAPKWIKTGVELYNGAPRLSTVACDTWADWSVGPLEPDADGDANWTTVAIEREGDHHGPSLWVYRVRKDGTKVPLREVCWVYGDGEGEGWEVKVEAFAARPATEGAGGKELTAEVKDFEVRWEN